MTDSFRRRKNHQDSHAEYARQEQERMKELDEEGLCVSCGDKPQVPQLPGKSCLECSEDSHMNCNVENCPNPRSVTIKQMDLCEIHAVNSIHSMYYGYTKRKSEVQDLEQEVDDMISDLDFDPRKDQKAPHELTEREDEVVDEWVHLLNEQRELHWLKSDIQKAIDQLDEVFPEGFNPSI